MLDEWFDFLAPALVFLFVSFVFFVVDFLLILTFVIFYGYFLEEMEMKMESQNTSPINNSTSTIDMQGDHQKALRRSSFRIQSSRTILTDIAN